MDVSGGDKSKLLAADYLGITRDEWEVVDHYVGPTLPDDRESSVKESELYFYPTKSLGRFKCSFSVSIVSIIGDPVLLSCYYFIFSSNRRSTWSRKAGSIQRRRRALCGFSTKSSFKQLSPYRKEVA